MKSSTAGPAFTRSMTRRGRFSMEHNSSIEWAPTIDLPDVSLVMRVRTFRFVCEEVVDFGDCTVESGDSET